MADHTILGWLLIGLVTGVLAKLVMPGRDPGGIAVTVLIGIAGALLAGFVAQGINPGSVGSWASHASALAGAIALLIVYRLMIARRG